MKKALILLGVLIFSLALAACAAPSGGDVPETAEPEQLASGAPAAPEDKTDEPEVHSHSPADSGNIVPHEPGGYCGNTVTKVSYDPMGGEEGWERSFWGDRSVALTDLLMYLDYSEGVCRCRPEYTVDTEFGEGYGINLSEAYARYEGKQVSLTDRQVEEIREILDWAAEQEPD